MVKNALTAYLRMLNCLDGAVYQQIRDDNGRVSYQPVLSIPLRSTICKNLFKQHFTSESNGDPILPTGSFPITIPFENEQTGHVLNLPDFGVMLLVKNGQRFDDYILHSIQQLNIKFAQACSACIQNEAVQKSEEKYRSIFNSIQDVYAEVDAVTGTILEISPSIELVSGYSRDEMLGKVISDYYAFPEQRTELMELLMREGSVNDYEVTLVNKDGLHRIASFTVSMTGRSGDEQPKVVGTMRNITERKKITDELERNEKNLRIINYFATSLAGTFSLNEILSDIATNCISELGLEESVIYLLNDDRTLLIQKVALGASEDRDYRAMNQIEIPIGKGISGAVAKTGRPEIVNDVSKDKRYITTGEARGSEITVPIIYDEQVIGVINSEHSEKDYFKEYHLQIFEAIASLAANKIMRAISLQETLASESMKSAVINTSMDCIISIDADGLITEFNPAAEKTLGYKKSVILGKKLVDTIIPDDYQEKHLEGMKKYITSGTGPVLGKRIEISARRADGKIIPVEVSVTPISIGDELSFTAYLRDISSQKEAEQQVKLQAQTLEAAANGIVITDLDGNILWVNEAFTKLTGYSKDEAIGENPRVLKSGKHLDEFYTEMWNTIIKGEVWHGELINRRKNGTLYTEEMTIAPVTDESGMISNFIAVKQDISDRKEAEQVLRDNERTKTNFVSNVSHELRTPLASIQGFAGTILRDKKMPDEVKMEFIKVIFDESQRLTRLIENVLDISRIESGHITYTPQPILLASLVEEVVESQKVMAGKKELTMEVEIDQSLPIMMVSHDGMKQVAINLIGNAIKFTDPGGVVKVSMKQDGNNVRFQVSDNGLGIPESDLENIFQKFYRIHREGREDQGTGIGLAIVNEIVSQHQGKINVTSEVGQGTSFDVVLPLEKYED